MATLSTLPTEIRLQILAAATPSCIPIPASQCPLAPLHGLNPLLRVSRQIRAEALTIAQPAVTAIVHVSNLDAEVGRRNVEERDLFQRIVVLGVEDGGKDVYASLRDCWVEVTPVAVPVMEEEEGRWSVRRLAGDMVCYSVRGACTAWSHYPWYMQAG